jgi:hypothetical protein
MISTWRRPPNGLIGAHWYAIEWREVWMTWGGQGMPTYALVLVILGSGSLSNSQPLRIGTFLSLSSCQAAAHDAMTIGFDGNASPGFVCVRMHEEPRELVAANSRRDDTKDVTVDTTRAAAIEGSSQPIAAETAKVAQHRAGRRGG